MLTRFNQAKYYLYSLIPAQSKAGIFEMRKIVKKLNNPQNSFKSIHITGTSGKGSTAYLIAKILKQAGYKTGLHLSPHLQDIRERIQINNKLISKKDFISLVNQIKPLGKISYFNALIIMSFLYFSKKKVDYTVIESGCGGAYDGTNIINSKTAVLTNIGLDHIKLLGKTIEKILKDKMQIIKPSCDFALSAIRQKNLQKIICRFCKNQKVNLFLYKRDFFAKNIFLNKNYSKFDFVFNQQKIKNIKLSLPGIFQIENVSLAIAVCLQLGISKGIIKKALSNAFFPGRLETVKNNIILDGAHNIDKVKALVSSIKKLYKNRKIIVIFGLKKGREPRDLLLSLAEISNKFIITQFGKKTDLGDKFNYKAEKLYKEAKQILPNKEIYLETDSYKALKKARKSRDLILITGSLYLIGEYKNYGLSKRN